MGHDTEIEAFGPLVAAHYPAIAAVAFAVTRDLALAEDVAQETFVAAWSQRGTLRDPARVRPWLCGIARNLARRTLRQRTRDVGTQDDALADPTPSLVDAALAREQMAALRKALDAVPSAYRESLVLFYWENQSIAEVASTLAISEHAAQKRISRARALLRDELTTHVEQVGRHRRSAEVVAASVVALLLAPTATQAAIQPAVARGAMTLRTGLALVVPAAVGGAVVLAVLAQREQPVCCTAVTAQTQRLHELTNKVLRLDFDQRELAKVVVTPVPPRPDVPTPEAPRRSAPRVMPVRETPIEPGTNTSNADTTLDCDKVLCVLENFAGACCQAYKATLKEVPSRMTGIRSWELK